MKFNLLKKKKTKQTFNHEGATAYWMPPELELYSTVVSSSLNPTFYEKENARLDRIKELVRKVSPNFVAQLAVYCRTKMHMRSVSLVLAVELGKVHKGDSLVSKTVKGVIQRADEITEILAYYQFANERKYNKKLNKLSKQLQKGVAQAFNKFDEYQFAKYNRKTEVTLKDALFLAHPKAKDAQQQNLFNKIVNDNLEVPYTWEVELSKLGQTQFDQGNSREAAFKAKWEELIDSGRLGYMALMRNLRNILDAKVSKTHLKKVAEKLSDPNAVKRSKQLPLRFLAAYKELALIQNTKKSFLMKALEKAVAISVENINGFDLDTRVLIAADVSGSMYTPISQKSKISCYDVGLLLSMLMANKSENVITGIFGNTWKTVDVPKDNMLANTQHLRKIAGQVGYSTNAHKVIDDMIRNRTQLDKVMFFTDLQLWDSKNGGSSLDKSWQIYKRDIAPQAKLYLFDLVGYGHAPLNTKDNDIYLIAGWSNKIFDVLNAIENGNDALTEIAKIEL